MVIATIMIKYITVVMLDHDLNEGAPGSNDMKLEAGWVIHDDHCSSLVFPTGQAVGRAKAGRSGRQPRPI